jgi:bacterioferritin
MSALPQTPQNKPPQNKPQLTDVKTLREQARRHIEEGAVTENYAANREKVLELLNEALATELVCVLRYRHDHFMARGFASKSAADEFLEHATEELEHADRIAERIVQLGGEPRFDPNGLTDRSHSEYRIGRTLQEAIQENLVAERIAIDSYREMVQYIGEADPTTRRMLEEILATEEEHADDLADLLLDAAPRN